MFKYFLYRFSQFIFSFLPIRVSCAIASALSFIVYCCSFKDRRYIRENLEIICDDKGAVKQNTREVFRNFGLYLVEFLYMKRNVDREFIEKNVELKDVSRLDAVIKENRGAILLTAHIGNWELGGVILSVLGYPIVAIALPHKEELVNRLFNDQRQSKGVKVVPMNGAIRQCSEALKENQFVALLADRDFSSTGEVMDFFGKRTSLPKGAAMFALRNDAPIIPIFLVRSGHSRFKLEVGQPMYPKDFIVSNDEKENVRHLITACAGIIEEKIKEYPSQWLMFRRFWLEGNHVGQDVAN